MSITKRENVAAHDVVDKIFVNFITPWDLIHTSDRLIVSRRFIDESSRKSESFIYAIIIPRIEKLGTASICRERQ